MNTTSAQAKTTLLTLISLGLTSLAIAHSTSAHHYVPTYAECEAQGNKITICHATSSETNPYVEETIACEALYGKNEHAGHFSENGTPLAGHEDDFVPHDGQTCNLTASPSPTATASADPSATPSATPEPSSNPGVGGGNPGGSNGSPSNTPSSSGEDPNSGRRTSLSNDLLVCPNKVFEAVFDVKEEGRPISGKYIHFTFNGQEKGTNTNENGRAKLTFDQTGATSGILTATTEGYPSQSMYVTIPRCDSVHLDPDRSRGQVLGATTLANTGRSSEYLALALIASGVITLAGTFYAYTHQKTA